VGHVDPLWLAELQRRYVTSGGPPTGPGPGHMPPGVYPPVAANLTPEVLQRERIGNLFQIVHRVHVCLCISVCLRYIYSVD